MRTYCLSSVIKLKAVRWQYWCVESLLLFASSWSEHYYNIIPNKISHSLDRASWYTLVIKTNMIHFLSWRMKDELDVTCYFISLLMCSNVSDINISIIRSLRLFCWISRKLLMMDILMSETYWTHKKWNKIASDIKLVFYSSNIATMHGPINIRYTFLT